MRDLSLIGIALIVIAAVNQPAFAQRPDLAATPASTPPLTDMAQLRVYVASKTVAVRSVAMEGVVTWVAASGAAFVLQEGVNAMRFDLQSPGVPARCGQRVRLTGDVMLGKASCRGLRDE